MSTEEEERLYWTNDVAEMFQVSPRTVERWAKTGKIKCVKTPGGHRRFKESTIKALLEEGYEGVTEDA